MYCQITNSTLDSLIYRNVFIRLNDPSNDALRAEMIESLETAIDDGEISVIDQYDLA